MTAAFEDVNHQVQWGESPIDPYASTNPAEFFAVVSEYFFTQPDLLQRLYPEVYTLLAGFYRQQPLEWLGEVQQIGRASCRERVLITKVVVAFQERKSRSRGLLHNRK